MNSTNHFAALKKNGIAQRAAVIWFTGLSGAGKTTLAKGLKQRLGLAQCPSVILDGDELRKGLNSELGFTREARMENIRRAAEIAKIVIDNEIWCIVSTISPYPELREMAQRIIGEDFYIEVFVNAPLSLCEERDVKGFYKKARRNLLSDFTGVQDLFIPPDKPNLEIKTDTMPVETCISEIYAYLQAYFPVLPTPTEPAHYAAGL